MIELAVNYPRGLIFISAALLTDRAQVPRTSKNRSALLASESSGCRDGVVRAFSRAPGTRQRKIVWRKLSGVYNAGHYGPKKENPSLVENLARTVHVGGAWIAHESCEAIASGGST